MLTRRLFQCRLPAEGQSSVSQRRVEPDERHEAPDAHASCRRRAHFRRRRAGPNPGPGPRRRLRVSRANLRGGDEQQLLPEAAEPVHAAQPHDPGVGGAGGHQHPGVPRAASEQR